MRGEGAWPGMREHGGGTVLGRNCSIIVPPTPFLPSWATAPQFLLHSPYHFTAVHCISVLFAAVSNCFGLRFHCIISYCSPLHCMKSHCTGSRLTCTECNGESVYSNEIQTCRLNVYPVQNFIETRHTCILCPKCCRLVACR